MPYGYKDKDRSDRHGGRGKGRGDSQSDDSRGHKRRKDDKKSSKKDVSSRSDKKDKHDRRDDRSGRGERRGDRSDRDRDKRARTDQRSKVDEPSQAPPKEEESPVNEDMDDTMGMQVEEDDEAVEKMREAAKQRREALMKKWVEEGTDDTGALPTNARHSSADEQDQDSFAKPPEEAVDEKALEEKMAVNRFILESRKEDGGDMFGDEADNVDKLNNQKQPQAGGMYINGASGEDWDDSEGYYRPTVGEKMGGRYLVTEANCGKGVFSNVVKATDTEDRHQALVAIKIMRCNDMMRKAAEKEVEVLRRIGHADKGGKTHCIRLIRTFEYRKHLCLVFECMWDNLRVALKKYTQGKGMGLRTVRSYTKQLLTALNHIHRCQYVHADIKPDNILISDVKEGRNVVKICDLGSAVELTEVEATAYLASRWYRSPEVTLGIKYGQACDTWALGATLMELYNGKPLFPGRTNNDMIRLFMDVKGKLPHKLITKGTLWKQHFNEQMDFKFIDVDKVTQKQKIRVISDCSAKHPIQDIVIEKIGVEKQGSSALADQYLLKKAKQFANLIEQMTTLDPDKRPSAADLLSHQFLAESWEEPGAAKTGASRK